MTDSSLEEQQSAHRARTRSAARAEEVGSTCRNLRSVGTYGSFSLQQRDSLRYHAETLASVVPFMRLRPGLLSANAESAIATALDVMKPYVLAEKSHPEFTCTTVQFDKDVVAQDPAQAKAWTPNGTAREALRQARIAFPAVGPWTKSLVTDAYPPWFKVYVTGKGDTLKP